jgi:hypothetical protein
LDIKRQNNIKNSSFISNVDPVDPEVRQNIAFMLRFVTELMQNGVINDFSIYRSSLEQVFKKLITMHVSDF